MVLGPVDPGQQSGLFSSGQFLEPADRPAGDNQCMPGRDRKLVGDYGDEVIKGNQSSGLNLAERRKHQRAGWCCNSSWELHLTKSVFNVEMLLAPEKAFDRRIELFFARGNDRLIGQGDQVLLAFDAGV